MTEQELTQTIKVLKNEVEILKGRLEPTATEYVTNEIRAKTKPNLNTLAALDVINGRIDELLQEALYRADELTDSLRGINGNLDANLNADVYDGYKDHTEAMEQARLRKLGSSAYQRAGAMEQARLKKIQDSAADKEFNGPFGMEEKKYTHTKEYFDRNRNRPMEGEDLPITDPFAEGLSNRSMKQKYGQAVQTVSEMMQEELEPLPINLFK